ncbi:MAG: RNA polymerase sigma factor [Bacteroidales bacterium]|nr:RNA polymerase sigma factor [Bacteroidales bacterium]
MTREESIAFYKAHSRRLYNVSLRIVRDSALAEEIMQDTILKYLSLPVSPLNALTSMSTQGPVVGWLVKTCIRASIDALRKMKRERLFLEEYGNEVAPEYFAPIVEDRKNEVSLPDIAVVKKEIEALPDSYGLVLNLVLIEGLDYEEISGLTGEQEGTIRTRYSRAKKMLADRLKEHATI